MRITRYIGTLIPCILLSACALDIPEEIEFRGSLSTPVRDFAHLSTVALDAGHAASTETHRPVQAVRGPLVEASHGGLKEKLIYQNGHRFGRDEGQYNPIENDKEDHGLVDVYDGGTDTGVPLGDAMISPDSDWVPDAHVLEDAMPPEDADRLEAALPPCPLVDNDCRFACIALNEYAFDSDRCPGFDEYTATTRNLVLIRCITNCNHRQATIQLYCGDRDPHEVLEDRRTLEIGFRSACRGTEPQDADHDGHAYPLDNCPTTSNPLQVDSDGDKNGDACDNCQNIHNTQQRDDDRDGIGNICTVEP